MLAQDAEARALFEGLTAGKKRAVMYAVARLRVPKGESKQPLGHLRIRGRAMRGGSSATILRQPADSNGALRYSLQPPDPFSVALLRGQFPHPLPMRILLCIVFSFTVATVGAQNLVTYAGSAGRDRFTDVVQLSDGTFLLRGGAEDLSWVSITVPVSTLPATGITSSATGSIGFILHLSRDLQTVLHVVRFPDGTVRDVSKFASPTASASLQVPCTSPAPATERPMPTMATSSRG